MRTVINAHASHDEADEEKKTTASSAWNVHVALHALVSLTNVLSTCLHDTIALRQSGPKGGCDCVDMVRIDHSFNGWILTTSSYVNVASWLPGCCERCVYRATFATDRSGPPFGT